MTQNGQQRFETDEDSSSKKGKKRKKKKRGKNVASL